MLAGSFLSASILGSVTTIIIKLYQGAEELKEMKQSIDDFIKHHRIGKQLAKQMQESFEHEWKNTKGIDMNSILKTFPECIQADICLHLNRELLNNCPVFEDANEVTLRALALLFKSTHVPPGDTLIHQGDILNSIYFIHGGQMEILQNNELLAIIGRNDTFGENPWNTITPGKSRCVVRGVTYCTLNKILRDDLHGVFKLYPDFAKSFIERFRLTFDLRQCQLNESKPFYRLDSDLQVLISERNPKLQPRERWSLYNQKEDEANRSAYSKTYRGFRIGASSSTRRPMNTIVELSPEQASASLEDFDFGRRETTATLTPLAHGVLANTFSAVIYMAEATKSTKADFQTESPKTLSSIIENDSSPKMQYPLRKYEHGPVRSIADIDAELSLLQMRFDTLEKSVDDKMKALIHIANDLALANTHRQYKSSNQTIDAHQFFST